MGFPVIAAEVNREGHSWVGDSYDGEVQCHLQTFDVQKPRDTFTQTLSGIPLKPSFPTVLCWAIYNIYFTPFISRSSQGNHFVSTRENPMVFCCWKWLVFVLVFFNFVQWQITIKPPFGRICCFLFQASSANPRWPWQAVMQRMQQKQKDAVATLAVEGTGRARFDFSRVEGGKPCPTRWIPTLVTSYKWSYNLEPLKWSYITYNPLKWQSK